jgi:mRNA interferase HigB
MIVIGNRLLEKFRTKHAHVRQPLNAWLAEVEDADWQSPNDIKARYASASFLDNQRVVFNLKGKRYRLLVKVAYKTRIVMVLNIGTHAEYNSWKL